VDVYEVLPSYGKPIGCRALVSRRPSLSACSQTPRYARCLPRLTSLHWFVARGYPWNATAWPPSTLKAPASVRVAHPKRGSTSIR
jgi:hypothetical protein